MCVGDFRSSDKFQILEGFSESSKEESSTLNPASLSIGIIREDAEQYIKRKPSNIMNNTEPPTVNKIVINSGSKYIKNRL